MGKALYRTHRPKKLAEVIGQEHITKTLDQALKQHRLSHAYLFTGPRGVGKTSIARILAYEINQLPYEDDSQHLDIIEIDAASNRRIDEIRDLRDKVYIAPTSAKYKVYIIDEVHMLTREAFNALLKTLEEPPVHVVFILATTDAHKLPDTIISRTQRYTFKPVELQKVVDHLRSIAKQEKVNISDDALALLAEHGEGSFRDSISLLDQASSQGSRLELADIQNLLGIPPAEAVSALLDELSHQAAVASVMQRLNQLYEQGFQAAAIAKQLSQLLRRQLVEDELGLPANQATALLSRLLEVSSSPVPDRYLELILLEIAIANQTIPTANPSAVTAEPLAITITPQTITAPAKPMSSKTEDSKAKAAKEKLIKPENTNVLVTAGNQENNAIKAVTNEQPAITVNIDADIWPKVLDALKKQYNTLYGVVRMAQPNFQTNGKLTLSFAFAFHQKRLNDVKHRQILSDIIKQLSGQTITIECIVDKNITQTPRLPKATEISATDQPASVSTDSNLSTISNIFGGGELLE